MPELPEVEVLVRHLRPLLKGKVVQGVKVHRARVLGSTPRRTFSATLRGARFGGVSRRGKYILFQLRRRSGKQACLLIGHLGMTGRMYLQARDRLLPKHTAVVLNLRKQEFIFEDTRYFGKLTLDRRGVERLGPEPLESEFTAEIFGRTLKRSRQAIKVKLLDQSVVAGMGNIYASEALFRAGISPKRAACRLGIEAVTKLWRAIREVLTEAVEFGSTVPLRYDGKEKRDGVFYFGQDQNTRDYYEEHLRVYDREGQPCATCGAKIKRVVQAARSTFYCPKCQPS